MQNCQPNYTQRPVIVHLCYLHGTVEKKQLDLILNVGNLDRFNDKINHLTDSR
jgi:hypothetical protein